MIGSKCINQFIRTFLITLVITTFFGCDKKQKESIPNELIGTWSKKHYNNPNFYSGDLNYDALSATITFERNRVFFDDFNYEKLRKYRISDVEVNDSPDSTVYILYLYSGKKNENKIFAFSFKKVTQHLDVLSFSFDPHIASLSYNFYEKVD